MLLSAHIEGGDPFALFIGGAVVLVIGTMFCVHYYTNSQYLRRMRADLRGGDTIHVSSEWGGSDYRLIRWDRKRMVLFPGKEEFDPNDEQHIKQLVFAKYSFNIQNRSFDDRVMLVKKKAQLKRVESALYQ